MLNEIIPVLGIEPERFYYTWISASEGQLLKTRVEQFVEGLKKVGKFDSSVFNTLGPEMVKEITGAKEGVEA